MSSLFTLIKGGPPIRSGNLYNYECPTGTYINKFYGRVGAAMDYIGVVCSNGDKHEVAPSSGGNGWEVDSDGVGFQSIMSTGFDGGNVYQSFNGHGSTAFNGPYPPDIFQYRCPKDTYMNSISGTYDRYVNQIDLGCEIKPEYCIDHLESDACQWLMPKLKDADVNKYNLILNKACSKNMSATCRDNRHI